MTMPGTLTFPTMSRPRRMLLRALRAVVVAQVLLGLLLWAGFVVPWRSVHLGLALGALLLAVGAAAARAAGRATAAVAAGAWTALLVGYGVAHPGLWPGRLHWVAQVVHVLIGLATLGVAERLAAARGRAAA
jgi:hypothetical protein